MADTSIRKDFVEGVQEIFTTLFNEGVEDGLDLYLMSDKSIKNVYGESKAKVYKAPVKLVCQAHINPTHGQQDVEEVKGVADFVVPLKDLQDKEIDVSTVGLEVIRRGVIKFHDTFYKIDRIVPKAFVEDVFLMFTFYCTEDIHVSKVLVEESEVEEDGSDTSNDG